MRVIYPGHRYALANLKDDGEAILQFRQDAPLHEPRPGTSCQEVIRALIDRVKELHGEEPWEGNLSIIQRLRTDIAAFEARALIRKVEKGLLEIEALPTGLDGHLIFASAMSAGTAETTQIGSGLQPASAVRNADSADAHPTPEPHS